MRWCFRETLCNYLHRNLLYLVHGPAYFYYMLEAVRIYSTSVITHWLVRLGESGIREYCCRKAKLCSLDWNPYRISAPLQTHYNYTNMFAIDWCIPSQPEATPFFLPFPETYNLYISSICFSSRPLLGTHLLPFRRLRTLSAYHGNRLLLPNTIVQIIQKTS